MSLKFLGLLVSTLFINQIRSEESSSQLAFDLSSNAQPVENNYENSFVVNIIIGQPLVINVNGADITESLNSDQFINEIRNVISKFLPCFVPSQTTTTITTQSPTTQSNENNLRQKLLETLGEFFTPDEVAQLGDLTDEYIEQILERLNEPAPASSATPSGEVTASVGIETSSNTEEENTVTTETPLELSFIDRILEIIKPYLDPESFARIEEILPEALRQNLPLDQLLSILSNELSEEDFNNISQILAELLQRPEVFGALIRDIVKELPQEVWDKLKKLPPPFNTLVPMIKNNPEMLFTMLKSLCEQPEQMAYFAALLEDYVKNSEYSEIIDDATGELGPEELAFIQDLLNQLLPDCPALNDLIEQFLGISTEGSGVSQPPDADTTVPEDNTTVGSTVTDATDVTSQTERPWTIFDSILETLRPYLPPDVYARLEQLLPELLKQNISYFDILQQLKNELPPESLDMLIQLLPQILSNPEVYKHLVSELLNHLPQEVWDQISKLPAPFNMILPLLKNDPETALAMLKSMCSQPQYLAYMAQLLMSKLPADVKAQIENPTEILDQEEVEFIKDIIRMIIPDCVALEDVLDEFFGSDDQNNGETTVKPEDEVDTEESENEEEPKDEGIIPESIKHVLTPILGGLRPMCDDLDRIKAMVEALKSIISPQIFASIDLKIQRASDPDFAAFKAFVEDILPDCPAVQEFIDEWFYSYRTTTTLVVTETIPTEASPSESSPTEASPSESAPTEASPSESAPTEASPSESAPTEASPSESIPTEASPSESSPTEASPSESAPTEASPSESVPTEASPSESVPTEASPSESVPTEASTTETIPTEASPSESSPTEASPSQSAPTEASPSESAPTEASPSESVPTEASTTETIPTEASPSESVPTEVSPSEFVPSESVTIVTTQSQSTQSVSMSTSKATSTSTSTKPLSTTTKPTSTTTKPTTSTTTTTTTKPTTTTARVTTIMTTTSKQTTATTVKPKLPTRIQQLVNKICNTFALGDKKCGKVQSFFDLLPVYQAKGMEIEDIPVDEARQAMLPLVKLIPGLNPDNISDAAIKDWQKMAGPIVRGLENETMTVDEAFSKLSASLFSLMSQSFFPTSFTLPTFTTMSIPTLTTMPMPTFTTMSIPTFTTMTMPTFTTMKLTTMTIPTFTTMKLTTMTTMKMTTMTTMKLTTMTTIKLTMPTFTTVKTTKLTMPTFTTVKTTKLKIPTFTTMKVTTAAWMG